ncbi:MAG TPA: hypothetical protein VN380_09140 [Thermoanaerobaculia bacterium]|jgi:hypothetical protein|nr:hypothetical protein [Thermoanaerobaculia bacterium]
MPTPYESAKLILQIFEMRRETVIREARLWFVRDFNPETIDDFKAALAGPHNPHMRMVVGYWDMACSLVNHDAIDRQMFLDANGEIFATFAKIHLLLPEIRQVSGPGFGKHLEQVVMSAPGIEERLEMLRQRFRAMAAAAKAAGS